MSNVDSITCTWENKEVEKIGFKGYFICNGDVSK